MRFRVVDSAIYAKFIEEKRLSILLESLSQQNKDSNLHSHQVPDVSDSHFDEQVFDDSGLYRRVRLWRLSAITLLLLLLASWSYFVLKLDKAEVGRSEVNKVIGKVVNDEAINITAEVSEQPAKTTPPRRVYKPQKRQLEAGAQIQHNNVQDNPEIKQDVQFDAAKTSAATQNNQLVPVAADSPQVKAPGAAILKEQLSADLQSQFPQIEIDSYVVADSAEKSFVILDGAFYKVNQVIAPDLILRDISRTHLVVEFHSQLVKLPFN